MNFLKEPVSLLMLFAALLWVGKIGLDYFGWYKLKGLEKKDDVLKDKIDTLNVKLQNDQKQLDQIAKDEKIKTSQEAEDFWNKQ